MPRQPTVTVGRVLFVVAALTAVFFLVREFQNLPFESWAEQATHFAEQKGPYGVWIFIGVYVLATLCLFPCAVLTVAAGVMYGFWGFPLVVASATLGAVIAFLIARYFAYEAVDRVFEKRPFTRALKQALRNEGWKFMLLLRISPLIPFNLNNYLLGAAPVSFASYIFTTLLGTVPGTALYIYLGAFGRHHQPPEVTFAFFLLGLVAIIALGRMTIHRTKKVLSEQQSLQGAP